MNRFFARVVPTGFCWEWQGGMDRYGYGFTSYHGRTSRAHRVAWQLLVGPIPDGLVLDHLCRNRACVNPDHLEPVTLQENLARGRRIRNVQSKRKQPRRIERDAMGRLQRCINDHQLTPDTTLLTLKEGKVRARCMTCQHETQERIRRNSGAPARQRRGSYGPRNLELFAEYWGFTYEEWLARRESLGAESLTFPGGSGWRLQPVSVAV